MANVKIKNLDRHSPKTIHVPGCPALHLAPAREDGSSVVIAADPANLGPEVAGLKRAKLITVEVQ